MTVIKTPDACGRILCHDLTEVIPGTSKTTRFRKGHIIREEDIPVLLDMGKEQLYVWEETPGMFHEEAGAERLRIICQGVNITAAPVREGKIELFAAAPGLLKIDSPTLIALNSLDGIAVITRRGNRGVAAGEKIAALKIIPLLIAAEILERASALSGGRPPINIMPFKPTKAGLIVTGNEIHHGRIPDTGSEIIRKKIAAYPAECIETVTVDDNPAAITARILDMITRGIDLIICTGGMSVDPDDKTPLAIKNTGARIVTYGVPLMPGTMLMLAYMEKNEKSGGAVPIIGAPACVFYEHTTALDILLPRLMARDPIRREELALLGEGGLRLN
jgi:molybdopterin biosynthesis enzyme